MSEQLTDTHHITYKTPNWMQTAVEQACLKAVQEGRWFEVKPRGGGGDNGDTGFTVTIERAKKHPDFTIHLADIEDEINKLKDRWGADEGKTLGVAALGTLFNQLTRRIAGRAGAAP